MKKSENTKKIPTKGTITKTVLVKIGSSTEVRGLTVPRPINNIKFY